MHFRPVRSRQERDGWNGLPPLPFRNGSAGSFLSAGECVGGLPESPPDPSTRKRPRFAGPQETVRKKQNEGLVERR